MAGLPTPLPGNGCLFLACVGSLLSTAADGLYLAGFNELRVADVRLGSTFLACVRICLCLVWSVRVCVRTCREMCAMHLRVCISVCVNASVHSFM